MISAPFVVSCSASAVWHRSIAWCRAAQNAVSNSSACSSRCGLKASSELSSQSQPPVQHLNAAFRLTVNTRSLTYASQGCACCVGCAVRCWLSSSMAASHAVWVVVIVMVSICPLYEALLCVGLGRCFLPCRLMCGSGIVQRCAYGG